MPFHYSIDKARRLVISVGEGVVTFDDAKTHQDKLLLDPAFDASYSQLVDMTAATELAFTADQAIMLARRRVFAAGARRAFVAVKPAVYGLGRLMQAYHEYCEANVFYDMKSALEWLGVPQFPLV
jgi:hypothetical protein